MADSLETTTSTFKPPQNPLLRYEAEARHKPSVPDNVKYQQVFEDENQIKMFMDVIGEFSNVVIDQEGQDIEEIEVVEQQGP